MAQPVSNTLGDDGKTKELHPLQTRPVKVDFPRFEGVDVLPWIFKAEMFFKYYNISDPYRLDIASIHFDGPIIPWF